MSRNINQTHIWYNIHHKYSELIVAVFYIYDHCIVKPFSTDIDMFGIVAGIFSPSIFRYNVCMYWLSVSVENGKMLLDQE